MQLNTVLNAQANTAHKINMIGNSKMYQIARKFYLENKLFFLKLFYLYDFLKIFISKLYCKGKSQINDCFKILEI